MRKIIRLTESDLVRIVNRVIKEQPDNFGGRYSPYAVEYRAELFQKYPDLLSLMMDAMLWPIPLVGPILVAIKNTSEGVISYKQGHEVEGVIKILTSPLGIGRVIKVLKVLNVGGNIVNMLNLINKSGLPLLISKGKEEFLKWGWNNFGKDFEDFLKLLTNKEKVIQILNDIKTELENKKKIKLKESDLVRFIRKIINEQSDVDLLVRKAHNKIDELEFTKEDYFNYKECRRKKHSFPNYIPTEEEKLAFKKYVRQKAKGLDPGAPFKGKGRKEESFTPEEYFNYKEYKRKKRTSPNYEPTEEERVAYNKYYRQKKKGIDALNPFRKKEEDHLTNSTQSVNEDKSIDQILDKIGMGGMGSLSSKERRTLYGSGIKTKDTPDDYPHSLMVIPFYNPQTPLSNQNTGLKLREQHIEKLLSRYNIPSKVSYGFLGLGLGFVYYVNLKLSEHLEDVKTILERKGYTVYSNERSDQGVPPSVEDKIKKYEKSRPDIVFEKKHNFDLSMRQELQRVSKLLRMNKISNYFMDGIGENMIGLTFEINPKKRKTPEDLIRVLEKSGYEIIENNYMKNHS